MLRPVAELSAMMSEIEATDLGERLAWTGPNDELGRLCVTFDRLLDRLETAFERERRFIADASHELRTPLSVMRAEVELALMHERTPEAYRAALERMQRETQRLEALAKSLILTTRDGETWQPIPVDMSDIAMRAIERMRPLAEAHGIVLRCSTTATASVTADASMLERAVVSLIDNALRFARTEVRVGVTRANGSASPRGCSDDGPGFSDTALHDSRDKALLARRSGPQRSGNRTRPCDRALHRRTAWRHDRAAQRRRRCRRRRRADAYSFCCNVSVSCAGAIPNSSLGAGAAPLTGFVMGAVPKPRYP